MRTLRTRIAPTPSGHLHRGNAFAFLATYLWAQVNEASLMLRIDDLDQPRYRRRYAESIFRVLENLGIEWQEGPQSIAELEGEWSQSSRRDLYDDALRLLAQKATLFGCSCSRGDLVPTKGGYQYIGTCLNQNLPLHGEQLAWRYRHVSPVELLDFNGQLHLVGLPPIQHFPVLRRKDGLPAYHVASVVDDLHFGVTHLIRGIDLWDSSLAQLSLAASFNVAFAERHFYHHSLVVQPSGQKLSKSKQATPVSDELTSLKGRRSFYADFCNWLGLSKPYESTVALLRALQTVERHPWPSDHRG